MIDLIRTNLYKTLEVLLPAITDIFQESPASGPISSDFITAGVKPLIKKPLLDPYELKDDRAIFNLIFL